MRHLEEKMEKVNIGLSFAFLLLLGVYIFLLFSYRPFMGDDFSFYYYKKVSGYIDPELSKTMEFETKIGIPFMQRLEIMKYSYQNISGRVVSMLLSMLFSAINNRILFAGFAVFIYIGIVLLCGLLVFQNIREACKHPFVLILFGSFLWLYNEGVGNLYMFTMLFHYGVTYFLWLCMILFIRDYVKTEKTYRFWQVTGVNFLGFLAGLTHEMIGALALLMIAVIAIGGLGWKKGIGCIRFYIGAAIGYLICFFAPGNFRRAGTDHDAAISNPYRMKLIGSLKQHIATFLQMEEIGKWLLLTAILLFLGAFFWRIRNAAREKRKISWKEPLFWQLMVVISVFMWAAVSYVPKYGILLAMISQMMVFLRLLYEPQPGERRTEEGNVLMMVVSTVFLLLIAFNLRWVPQMIKETNERNVLVEEAARKGEEEVVVPSYSEAVTAHSVMVPNNLNNSAFYRGKKVSKLYYGTLIIVEGQDQ